MSGKTRLGIFLSIIWLLFSAVLALSFRPSERRAGVHRDNAHCGGACLAWMGICLDESRVRQRQHALS